MTKRIDVPGVGIVEFPDSMSDEQVTNAIRTNIMPKYSAQMETPTQTFGRSAASLADTAINTVRGLADIPVRAVSRAYYGGLKGVPLEQQEPLLQKVSNAILPQQDVVGKIFGVTGTPGYEQAPLRQLGTYAGETIGQNVIQPLAQATGLPEGYVGDVVNLGTAAVAPAIPKVAKVAATPITETAAGFRQGLAQPKYQRGAGSSFVPLQEQFYPSKQVDPFMKATPEQRVAMLPELEASQKPSSSLFTSTPGMLARNLGPKAENQTLIPYRGETFRAFGEQLARDISDRPLVSGGLGLGGAVLGGLVGGIPGALIGGAIAPGVRAGQLGSISTLGRTARFSRGFPEALGEAQATAGRQMMTPGPVAPQLGYNPNIVIPAGTQPRTVNIEGQSYNLPYQIDTSQAQTARAPQTSTPVPDLAQLAAQRSAAEARSVVQRQAAQQSSQQTAKQNDILAQIRARQNQPPAPPPEPTGGVTVTPTPSGPQPQGGGSLFDPQNFNRLSDKDKLFAVRQRLAQEPQQTITPAQEKQMRSELAQSSKATSQDIINDFVSKGSSEKAASTNPIDMGKDAYNGSRATQGMAKALVKKGIDEIPVIEGMTDSQVIHAIHSQISKKKGPSNVSQMLIDEGSTPASKNLNINPTRTKNSFDILKKPDMADEFGTGELQRTWKEGDSKLFELSDPTYGEHQLKVESPRGKYDVSTMDDGQARVKLDVDVGDHILTFEKSYDNSVNRISKTNKQTNAVYDNYVFENGKLTVHMGQGKPEYKKFPSISKLNELIDYIKHGD